MRAAQDAHRASARRRRAWTTRRRGAYLAAVRRYFEPYEREAQGQLRHVDRELERLYLQQFNLAAERGVVAKRIEAVRGVLGALAELRARMKVFDEVGRGTIGAFAYAGGVAELLGDALRFIVGLRIRLRETLDQAYLLGVQSLSIVILTSLFTGMVFSLESAVQAVSYGVGNLVGGAVAFTTARELGPMLSAVVVAGRTGAAIAAELGSMVVTEQIEALQSLGLSPTRMLVVPRLLALVVMLPLLTILADIVSIIGGMWVAGIYAHISQESFITSARAALPFEDVLKGLFKSVVFAVIIAMIGSYQGLDDARRRGRRRQGDDRRGRHVDHPDLHLQLRALVRAVRVVVMALWARLDDVCVRYGPKIVMQNLSLDIVEGAITCIIGLSGAGKSTILRLLNGLKKPDTGRVFVRGNDITEMRERDLIDLRRTIGFAFQFSALFDSLTIGENVALPLREHTKMPDKPRSASSSARRSIRSAWRTSRTAIPSELSGGMVKRAGFARAVVTNPAAVLYDEPTTGLDPIITHVLTDTIVKLREKLNGTAVVVSHDLESIYIMADYIAMLFEGAIVAYGTVDEIRRSPNPIVQQFLQGSEVGPDPDLRS